MNETITKSLISYLRPLEQFQSGWIDELSDIAGNFFKKNNAENQNTLLFKPANETLNIFHQSGLTESQTALTFAEINTVLNASTEVILEVPENSGLCKRITLPRAAKDDLRVILYNQIDRITPFTADQIYFSYQIIDDDPASDHIELNFYIIPKSKFETIIEKITSYGIKIDRLILENADHEMNFLPRNENNINGVNSKNISAFKFWLSLAMLLGILLIPTGYYEYRINNLQKDVDNTDNSAQSAIALNTLFESHKADMIYLVDKKQNNPLSLQIINEISVLLGDDTWLDQLIIKGENVQLYGYSASATKTLEALEQSALFRNAQFMAAVVQNNLQNAERFQISLDLSVVEP